MNTFFKSFLVFASISCFAYSISLAQEMNPWADSARAYQDELNRQYESPEESPLKPEDRENFEGLDFFPIDMDYRVEAKFVLNPKQKYKSMPTTSSRVDLYRKYGELHFAIKGKKFVLQVYKSKQLERVPAYKDYLFLPFRDQSNGVDTYGGGRYIGLYHALGDGDTIWLDFNRAYNPYCAYNDAYSCPIVPQVNTLDIRVEAGVKKYAKK